MNNIELGILNALTFTDIHMSYSGWEDCREYIDSDTYQAGKEYFEAFKDSEVANSGPFITALNNLYDKGCVEYQNKLIITDIGRRCLEIFDRTVQTDKTN